MRKKLTIAASAITIVAISAAMIQLNAFANNTETTKNATVKLMLQSDSPIAAADLWLEYDPALKITSVSYPFSEEELLTTPYQYDDSKIKFGAVQKNGEGFSVDFSKPTAAIEIEFESDDILNGKTLTFDQKYVNVCIYENDEVLYDVLAYDRPDGNIVKSQLVVGDNVYNLDGKTEIKIPDKITQTTSSETVSSEVTSKPTSSETTSKPTASKVISKPVESEVTSKPDSSEVTSKPTSSETTSKPIESETASSDVTSKPTSSEAASKPTASEVTSKPTSSKIDSEPTASETTSKPASSEVTSKPTSSEVTSKPTSSEVTSKPTSSETTSKPTSSEVTSKPTSSEVTSKPTSSEVTSKPQGHYGILGDVDDDGYITSADALQILRESAGYKSIKHFSLADVDDDGYITSADALAVLRTSAGYTHKDIGTKQVKI